MHQGLGIGKANVPSRTATPSRLRCSDLLVKIGGVVPVKEVTLELEQGEIVGLIGPNGAGKTTMLNALSGFMHPTSGSVSVDGVDITDWSTRDRARLGVARTFQGVRLFDDLSVYENVEVAALSVGRRTRRREAAERAEAALRAVGLASHRDRMATSLPYGLQRLAGIARALALEPRFLLLDEPAAGLNEEESADVAACIAGFSARGIGVLLVEHDMQVVMGISDRVHVLDAGATLATGSPGEVRRDPDVIRAYLGTGDGSDA